MNYPNKLNHQAFESIVKVMGPNVDIREDDYRVSVCVAVRDDTGRLHTALANFRKYASKSKRLSSIFVIIGIHGEPEKEEIIRIGSYDQIADVKKRIAAHLAV